MKVLDIFAGAGGFSLGFQMAGYDVIGAIEIDKWATDTFAHNHPEARVICDDITALSNGRISKTFQGNEPDILIGGPPCQGFSHCNSKTAGDPRDPRNSLFTEMLRLSDIFNPELVVMENVPNLVKAKTSRGKLVIDIIIDEFKDRGYHTYFDILEAVNYGVPQIRRRLFVIASKVELDKPFPRPTHALHPEKKSIRRTPTLWEAISDLPTIAAREGSQEMYYDDKGHNTFQKQMRRNSRKLYNHQAMKHTKRIIERFASMSCGESVSDVPDHLKPFKRNSNGIISDKVYDQNNRRMHPDRPCHTIAASFYANFVHPFLDRNFTPREGARIQSFPDTFQFLGKPTVVSHKLLEREGRLGEKYLCQYNQIGNAVPPLMAKAIASHLKRHLLKLRH